MPPRRATLLVVLCALVAAWPAPADDQAFQTKKAQTARRDFDRATTSARQAYETKVDAAQRQYLRELKDHQKAAMRGGDLEEARRIGDVVDWLARVLAAGEGAARPADRRPLTSEGALDSQRRYQTAVDEASAAHKAARVRALETYRTGLDASLQPVLRAGKDLGEAERIQAAIRWALAELDAIRATEGWVVLFRSRHPEDWDTFQDQGERYAVPLSAAPKETRYVRLRRMDTHAYVLLRVGVDDLGRDAEAGRFGWVGAKVLNEGGLHLGIDSTDLHFTYRDGGRIMVSNRRTTGGWGFGHKIHVNDAQYWSWAGEEIAPVAFEIAVTSRDLGEDERAFLLGP
ncbi:MAG: hypothetical protein KF878_19220 [Planctomycetes bacterium]|nr:hypothetical protein [Planctomycetota bacterium]